jgi:hypothetical protein
MLLPMLLICLVALLAVCVSAWLFVKLRAALGQLAKSIAVHEQLSEQTAALNVRLVALEARLNTVDQSRKEHSDWLSQAESLNLNRRGQVLRLHHRGDSVSDIASALRMRKGEVQLMIKVYELSRENFRTDLLL